MWPAIAAVSVVLALVGLLIFYARKEGIKDERLENIEEGQKAHEREHEVVNAETGRYLLRVLRRTSKRLRRSAGRDAGSLHPPD